MIFFSLVGNFSGDLLDQFSYINLDNKRIRQSQEKSMVVKVYWGMQPESSL
jgi:hypothetical protein